MTEVSVVIPTYNERGALRLLDPRLRMALAGFDAEIVVVDDASPDGTAQLVRDLTETGGRYRLIERSGRLGLASAVLEGFERSVGTSIAVMDADGSHPPELLPGLLDPIRTERAEFVLASRWVRGGSAPGLVGTRRAVSWGAAVLARPLVSVKDPMSGFFAFRRRVLSRAQLAPVGFKIGLEIMVKCRPDPVWEVPFRFDVRVAGKSKLGRGEVGGYLRHLARLYLWRLGQVGRTSNTR